jgi:hypothetical protein
MTEKEMLEQVLEQAKQAVAALPAWKKTMLRRAHKAELALGVVPPNEDDRREEELRKNALAKLTDEEKEVLGL